MRFNLVSLLLTVVVVVCPTWQVFAQETQPEEKPPENTSEEKPAENTSEEKPPENTSEEKPAENTSEEKPAETTPKSSERTAKEILHRPVPKGEDITQDLVDRYTPQLYPSYVEWNSDATRNLPLMFDNPIPRIMSDRVKPLDERSIKNREYNDADYNLRKARVKKAVVDTRYKESLDPSLKIAWVKAERKTYTVERRDLDEIVKVTKQEEFPTISWAPHPKASLYTVYRFIKGLKAPAEFVALIAKTEFVDTTMIPGIEYGHYVRVVTPQEEEGPLNDDPAYSRALLDPEKLNANRESTQLNFLNPGLISEHGYLITQGELNRRKEDQERAATKEPSTN